MSQGSATGVVGQREPGRDGSRQGINKQQARTERSTRRLLKAAAEILVDEGVNALTLANVGERAGYSRGLVTTRFGSKDNMIRALVERMTSSWAATHIEPRMLGKAGLEALLEMLREMRDQIARSPQEVLALQALLFDALNPASVARGPILEYNENLNELIRSTIELGKHDGTIRSDVDSRLEASRALEGIRGIGFHWLLMPTGYDASAALSHLIDLVEEHLAAG